MLRHDRGFDVPVCNERIGHVGSDVYRTVSFTLEYYLDPSYSHPGQIALQLIADY